jgi:myo-inositol-1(or 4)-monophosphatase
VDLMTSVELDERMEVAVRAVRAGGRIAGDYFARRAELAIERKGLQDLVSIADRAVETEIRRHLEQAFPDDGILGEEHGGALAERLWVIDPIDGTANFLRGLPYWCVVVAFAVDGATRLALTYDVVHDELYLARHGQGATRNGVEITVSDRAAADEACVGLSFNFKSGERGYRKLIGDLIESRLDHRRMGSSALTLCHVADGRLEAMLAMGCNSWDVIAGLLLVQEAGGYATDYVDGATLLECRPVGAATPALRQTVERISGLTLAPAR